MENGNGGTVASEPPPRIVRDRQGVPMIAAANTKVVEVVRHQQATGHSPDQICEDLPHLSLAQVDAALSFYEDHQEEIEDDLKRRAAYVDHLREELRQPPIVEKIRKKRSGVD